MGPLQGLKVVEFAAVGPVPFCAMLLADMGADVVRVDRPDAVELGVAQDPRHELNLRNRRSIAVDLKSPDGLAIVRSLIGESDMLLEGFRPGVMERLGLGPADCAEFNHRLIYGRMTGWGQTGPLAQAAAHDINYIAFAGALNYLGSFDGPPIPAPMGWLGDLGGGALYLAFGVVCAIQERHRSGRGQVVDAAIVDGVTSLLTPMHGRRAGGSVSDHRGEQVTDGSRPWYRSYETSDGRWISIGPIEERFYARLLAEVGLDKEDLPARHDRSAWPELERRLTVMFKTKTQREWVELLEGTDACFAPVLTLGEVMKHPHARQRGMFTEFQGQMHPMPAPRFSRSQPEIHRPPATAGAHTDEVLTERGYTRDDIARLKACGAVR